MESTAIMESTGITESTRICIDFSFRLIDLA